jgi:hypothetical protein
MFCSSCGGKLNTDALFCNHCGSETSQKPSKPSSATPSKTGKPGHKKYIVGVAAFILVAVGAFLIFGGGELDESCALNSCDSILVEGSRYCTMHTCMNIGCNGYRSGSSANPNHCNECNRQEAARLRNEEREALLEAQCEAPRTLCENLKFPESRFCIEHICSNHDYLGCLEFASRRAALSSIYLICSKCYERNNPDF